MKNILNMSLAQASTSLESKEITSLELTNSCLARIKAHDHKLGSFLLVDEEGAVKQAQAADIRRSEGKSLGALDGVPVAIKDNILTAGLKTTAGSRILENYVPPYDATAVNNLKKQGAVIVGKLNLDEFGMGSSNENSAYKLCLNPWDKKRTPGGSSGGAAAALAAQFCYGALGTDTGGSVRQPAAFCGMVGLKPTYGRVSRHGVIAFASSLDQVGPMAADVKSAAHLLSCIAGADERDSTSVRESVPNYSDGLHGDVKNLKVGIPKEYFIEGLSPEVRKSIDKAKEALQSRGAQLVDISLPSTPYAVATYYVIAAAEASSNLSRYDGVRYGPRVGDKDGLRSMYEHTRGKLFGPEVKRRIMLGTYVLSAGYYDAYYVHAQKVRSLFAKDFAEAFTKVDVILSPTAPTTAFQIGEKANDPLTMYLNDIFTIGISLAGIPALSLNSGFDSNGLPIGAQLMAKPFAEQVLLNAAYALEKELDVVRYPSL